MAAAAGVLRNCRPRYTRDEESYFDELASALSDMEGEAAGPVVVTSDAHVVTCRCCGEELDVDTDFDTLSASQWAAMPFSTPAELRACLDRLAGGVS